MGLIIMVVNEKRILINEDSKVCDKVCEEILEHYPSDAIVEFDVVKLADVKPKTLTELLTNN